MPTFDFQETSLKDARRILPLYSEDERGSFTKTYEKGLFSKNGIDFTPYETFETHSQKGVLRGLHFQWEQPQAKLVRVIFGEVFDVIVDLRGDSLTFGKWEGFSLTAENRAALYVPQGFAHGFYVLSDSALVSYSCGGPYSKDTDTGIRWDDPNLSIAWPLASGNLPMVSQRDRMLLSWKEFMEAEA